jgi:pimeloyl-ACP methyl ester carboxylesterase
MRRLAVLLTLMAAPLFAQRHDRVELIEDRENLVTQLRIEATDGKVAIADIFRAVSRLNGYDDAELQGALPRGHISLDGRMSRWTIGVFNKIMKPCVQVTSGDRAMLIAIDRESSQRWINDCKADLRWAWNKVDWRSEAFDYGIEIIGESETPRDIVVMVHGLNSRPEDLLSLVPVIRSANLIPATFRFPNDQPITQSAKLLANELHQLKAEYPSRKVRLLTHSMGGLVARAAVETDLDPGNVSQLIMIGPPNHGSSLARVAMFMDCYEFCSSADHRRAGALIESVSDGLGEATADLEPHSVFLGRLNNQKRNANIRYTILLGTGGPMNEEEMNSLRGRVRECTNDNRFVRFVSSKLNGSLKDLVEVVEGKGDGAVSCERGNLAGVQDVMELPFSHANILNASEKVTKEAHTIIRDRLLK